MADYSARRDVMIAKKGEEFARKKDAAHRKIEEEKAKRRKALLQAKEEERKRAEEAERIKREQEEEEQRLEAGMCLNLSFRTTFTDTKRICRALGRRRASTRRSRG